MKISQNEIIHAFGLLIDENKPREEIANWAQKLQFADDEENLEYDPPDQEIKIWDGIEYLMGVDLKDVDGSYLHSVENFIDFRNKLKLK